MMDTGQLLSSSTSVDVEGAHSAAESWHSAGPGTIDANQPPAPGTSEATAPKRVNPDDGRFIRLVVGGVVIAGLVAFAISFTALYEVAEWLGIPPFMWWAVPVFIDLAILVYAASVLVHKARGEQTWPSWAALGTFTALSVFANASHSLSSPQEVPWQGVVGAIIAGMVPIAIFVATEQLSRVAVEDPASRRAELREQARMEQAHAEHARVRADMRLERERHERKMAHEREAAERAAELDRVRHQAEIAKLRADKDMEGRRAGTPTHSDPELSESHSSQQDDDAVSDDGAIATSQRPLHVVAAHNASAPEPARTSVALDEVADFVAQHSVRGIKVSTAMLADKFKMSPRTGRRWLALLREKRPEVFHEHHAEEQWREQG